MDNAWLSSWWWELLKEVAIPVAAILIPTVIAVRLARREREAAQAQRHEEQRMAADQKALDTRTAAVYAALESMGDLVRATYIADRQESAQAAINGSLRLPQIALGLNGDDEVVWKWIREELGLVGRAVDDKDHTNLPRLGEQIVNRSAHFNDALTNWLAGDTDTAWFRSATALPISETPPVAPPS